MHEAHVWSAKVWLDGNVRRLSRKLNAPRKKMTADVLPVSLLSGLLAISGIIVACAAQCQADRKRTGPNA